MSINYQILAGTTAAANTVIPFAIQNTAAAGTNTVFLGIQNTAATVANIIWQECTFEGSSTNWVNIGSGPMPLPLSKEAIERGKALLKEILSDSEYQALYGEGLWIPSQLHKDRQYFIAYPGGQVRVYEKGKETGYYCIGPKGASFVDEDTILAKLMYLECCEEIFLKIAVFHPKPVPRG